MKAIVPLAFLAFLVPATAPAAVSLHQYRDDLDHLSLAIQLEHQAQQALENNQVDPATGALRKAHSQIAAILGHGYSNSTVAALAAARQRLNQAQDLMTDAQLDQAAARLAVVMSLERGAREHMKTEPLTEIQHCVPSRTSSGDGVVLRVSGCTKPVTQLTLKASAPLTQAGSGTCDQASSAKLVCTLSPPLEPGRQVSVGLRAPVPGAGTITVKTCRRVLGHAVCAQRVI
jgi:hypothetical protein